MFVRRLSDYITGRKIAGGSIVLTLHRAAQQAAYDGLAGKVGAVVALDPRTGAVLAMASRPSYDPTGLSTHDPSQDQVGVQVARRRPEEPAHQPRGPADLPAGLDVQGDHRRGGSRAGLTPGRPSSPSPTVLDLPQTTANLQNFGGETCGDGKTTTLADALRISCNTAFGALGITLGADAVRKQAKAFGFGDTSLQLPQPVADSIYPDSLTKAQEAQSAIGQYDVRVTPLQMAMVAAGDRQRRRRHAALPGQGGAGT